MSRHASRSPSEAAERIRRCARAIQQGVSRVTLLKRYSEREYEQAKKMVTVDRQ